MEFLEETGVLKFQSDTLQAIRKLYGLDQPRAMSDAVDILEEWVKKQDHFIKKDFDRGFLERIIIRAKGSIERSKQRLDKICTSKTLMPMYFVNRNVKELTHLEILEDVCLPRLTKDHYRVYLLRNVGQEFENQFFTNYYIRLISMLEYDYKYDYIAGLVLIFDFRKMNLMAFLKKTSLLEMQQIMTMAMECYGYRIKGLHIMSTSKLVETLVSMFRQIVSAKVGGRIHVHSTIESLHEYVEKDILPEEYGGTEIPLTELHKQYLDILSSKEHMDYMKMMNAAGTNEALRRTDKYNEQVLGMPGSFRSLRVD